jgi:hypothetical protein
MQGEDDGPGSVLAWLGRTTWLPGKRRGAGAAVGDLDAGHLLAQGLTCAPVSRSRRS